MIVSGHASEGLERREADDCVKSRMLQCRGANAGTRRHYHWNRGCLDSLEASVGGNGDKYLGSNMSHTLGATRCSWCSLSQTLACCTYSVVHPVDRFTRLFPQDLL